MEQWEIGRSTGICAVTGRELAEGEEYYTVLFEDGDTFRRADYTLDAWDGPPDQTYCYFKTRVPVREEKKTRLLVDDDVLVNFFIRLADETETARLQFRFVLALILMRKRLLKYEETRHEDQAEYWQMRLIGKHAAGGQHSVFNPHLTDEQIDDVAKQLGAILHGDAAIDDADQAPGADPGQPESAGQPEPTSSEDTAENA